MRITVIFLLFYTSAFTQINKREISESEYYSFHKDIPYFSEYEIIKCEKISAEFNYSDTGDIWVFGAYDSIIANQDSRLQEFFNLLFKDNYFQDKNGNSGNEVTERALRFRDTALIEDENGVLNPLPITSCLNRFFDKVIIDGIKVKLFDSTIYFQPQIIYFTKPKNRETFSITFQEFKKASFSFWIKEIKGNWGFDYALYITRMLADNYEFVGDGEYVMDDYLIDFFDDHVVYDSTTQTFYWGLDSIYPPRKLIKQYSIKHFYGAGIGVKKSPCFLWDIKTLESINLRDNLITKWEDYSKVPKSLKRIDLGYNSMSKREQRRMKRKLKGVDINFN